MTGSKYLLRIGNRRILVDCGLFQGYKQLRLRNRLALPIAPDEIDTVILTHAHLDHSGYLPVLVRDGFAGPVLATQATRDLCGILPPDSGRLQEEEVEFANRHGYSKHKPALLLEHRRGCLAQPAQFFAGGLRRDRDPGDGISLRLTPAGHMLGAASVRTEHGGRSIAFSGDVGRAEGAHPIRRRRWSPPIICGRVHLCGNRRHEDVDAPSALEAVFDRTFKRGGIVIIPCSRWVVSPDADVHDPSAQAERPHVPTYVPVYLNSPMAIDATRPHLKHHEYHRLTAQECEAVCVRVRGGHAGRIASAQRKDARAGRDHRRQRHATGGQVLGHIKAFGSDRRNTILFCWLPGRRHARRRAWWRGRRRVKIHGDYIPIQAEVANIDSLSGHADYAEMLEWLRAAKMRPRRVFVTHGEADAPTPCAITSRKARAGRPRCRSSCRRQLD